MGYIYLTWVSAGGAWQPHKDSKDAGDPQQRQPRSVVSEFPEK